MPFFDVPFDLGRHDGRNPPSWRPICDCELACMQASPNGALTNPQADDCFQACQNARSNLHPGRSEARVDRNTCHTRCRSESESSTTSGRQRTKCGEACNKAFLDTGDGIELGRCLYGCDIQMYAAQVRENGAFHSCAAGCESTWGAAYGNWAKSDALRAGNLCEPGGALGPRPDSYSGAVTAARVKYAGCVAGDFRTRSTELISCSAARDNAYGVAQLGFWQCVGPPGTITSGCGDAHAAARDAADVALSQCIASAELIYERAAAPCLRDGYRELKSAQALQFARDDRFSFSVRRKRGRYDAAVMLCCAEVEGIYLRNLRLIGAEYESCRSLTGGDPDGACAPAADQSRAGVSIVLLEAHRRCMRMRCNHPKMEGELKLGNWLGECLIDSLKTHLQCIQAGGENCDAEATARQAACQSSHAGYGCNHAFPVFLEYAVNLSPSIYMSGNAARWPDALFEPDLTDP